MGCWIPCPSFFAIKYVYIAYICITAKPNSVVALFLFCFLRTTSTPSHDLLTSSSSSIFLFYFYFFLSISFLAPLFWIAITFFFLLTSSQNASFQLHSRVSGRPIQKRKEFGRFLPLTTRKKENNSLCPFFYVYPPVTSCEWRPSSVMCRLFTTIYFIFFYSFLFLASCTDCIPSTLSLLPFYRFLSRFDIDAWPRVGDHPLRPLTSYRNLRIKRGNIKRLNVRHIRERRKEGKKK